MEEKKVVLPKPPKELRKVQPKEEKNPEVETYVAPEPEKTDPEIAENKTKSKPRRKLNFEPVTNWVGLFVSLAVLGLFVFLLVT